MSSNNLDFQNFFSTTLSGTITASDTVIYLNSLPTPSEGYLVIEPDSSTNREIIYYTSKGVNFVTCPSVADGRGVGGTSAGSHSNGATVQMNVTAEDLRAIQDGSSNTGMHQYFDESFRDYVLSGGTITQATGLIASISSGTAYINGRRLTFGAMSKTFTASKDTYVDLIETDGSNIATVSYTELASGATGSTPVSNGMHIAKVNTTAAAIATSAQYGVDTLNFPLKPVSPRPVGECVQQVDSLSTAVATGTTVIPGDDTIPQSSEGDQYMTATIIPRSATNKLVIEANVMVSNSAASYHQIVALFQDSTANALAATMSFGSTAGAILSIKLTYTMTAGTTSATTFKVRSGANTAGTTTFNGVTGGRLFGAIAKSSLVIREHTQ